MRTDDPYRTRHARLLAHRQPTAKGAHTRLRIGRPRGNEGSLKWSHLMHFLVHWLVHLCHPRVSHDWSRTFPSTDT